MKKRILTGDRPTGRLHIGHYFGSLKQRVELQDEYETYIIIADAQALTDNYDRPEKVRENIYEVAMDNLAVGLDPEKASIFIQSMIPEIAELTVFYSNLVTVSRLERNPTVKAEIAQKKGLFGEDGASVTYGFLGYPVSQAADITAFNADLVPVGDDQLPMIEQTREIANKFNNIYGNTINLPNAKLSDFPRIKGLDGNVKMGKSLGNAIYLADTPLETEKKVMKAITDPNKLKANDPADPNVCMVYYYHQLFSNPNLKTVCAECKKGTRGCVACKKELANLINEHLKPVRERRKYYEDRPELVKQILINGTNKARTTAKETMAKVKKSMKINYFE